MSLTTAPAWPSQITNVRSTLITCTQQTDHKLNTLCYNMCAVSLMERGMVSSAGDFVSLAEASARKGVHYQTVRRAISRGDLKARKVGGGVIIALADLDQWCPQYKHAPRRSQARGAE
jgi:excisionase family DNA binding protein